jgi:hypothetical protein
MYLGGELIDVLGVDPLAVFCRTLSCYPPRFFVRQALRLGTLQRGSFYQQPLPLVSSTGPAEPEDNCRKGRVFSTSAGQGGIAAW